MNHRGVGLRKCDPRYLAQPCYLSPFSDEEGDFLVIDTQNQRVLLLNHLLDVVRVFLDAPQPRRIVKSGHFLVGCCGSSEQCGLVSLYWPQKSVLQPLPD